MPAPVHVLGTYHLNYCKALYMGVPLKTIQKLQLVQNSQKKLTAVRYYGPGMPVLFCLSVCFRSAIQGTGMIFKALYGMRPECPVSCGVVVVQQEASQRKRVKSPYCSCRDQLQPPFCNWSLQTCISSLVSSSPRRERGQGDCQWRG